MDGAEFILVSIATKQSMKPEQLAEKSQLFKGYSKKSFAKKMANLENFSKGFPFAFWPKLPILSTFWKSCYFSANSSCFIDFLVSIE